MIESGITPGMRSCMFTVNKEYDDAVREEMLNGDLLKQKHATAQPV